jgi:hypothetical protein
MLGLRRRRKRRKTLPTITVGNALGDRKSTRVSGV